ncbi:hypothetical protein AAT19DRAFT_16470 [Rhodotorula toruloides]|uniref:Uncharacterized protein n=1 Tax=Rhodotorula toruloides TaxID=5286 RepID=A0A2T0A3K8_RHOTO|nr:hypothetical protein AAT19DRAFT_16470 [Rhodotorula toruloides]
MQCHGVLHIVCTGGRASYGIKGTVLSPSLLSNRLLQLFVLGNAVTVLNLQDANVISVLLQPKSTGRAGGGGRSSYRVVGHESVHHEADCDRNDRADEGHQRGLYNGEGRVSFGIISPAQPAERESPLRSPKVEMPKPALSLDSPPRDRCFCEQRRV